VVLICLSSEDQKVAILTHTTAYPRSNLPPVIEPRNVCERGTTTREVKSFPHIVIFFSIEGPLLQILDNPKSSSRTTNKHDTIAMPVSRRYFDIRHSVLTPLAHPHLRLPIVRQDVPQRSTAGLFSQQNQLVKRPAHLETQARPHQRPVTRYRSKQV